MPAWRARTDVTTEGWVAARQPTKSVRNFEPMGRKVPKIPHKQRTVDSPGTFDPAGSQGLPTRRAVGLDERAVGLDERAVGFDGRAVGFDERAVGFDERAVGFDERAVGFDGRAVGFDERAVGFDERAVGLDERGPLSTWTPAFLDVTTVDRTKRPVRGARPPARGTSRAVRGRSPPVRGTSPPDRGARPTAPSSCSSFPHASRPSSRMPRAS